MSIYLLAIEYLQLKKQKKELERRLEHVEQELKQYCSERGNIAVFDKEIGYFERAKTEVDMIKLEDMVKLGKVRLVDVCKPNVTIIKNLSKVNKELEMLLTQQKEKIFTVKEREVKKQQVEQRAVVAIN